MKRFLSILLVAMLVVTCLATAAFATENEATVSVSSAAANRGDEVTLTYTVKGNFANFELMLKAGKGLELVSVNKNYNNMEVNLNTSSDKYGKVAYASSENVSKVVFYVTYKVTADAKCGKLNASATVDFISGEDLVDQGYTVVDGYVTVDHIWDNGTVTTKPDCVNTGVKTYTCTVCGETKTETIPANGHSKGNVPVRQNPTCTEDGFQYYVCNVCGEKFDHVVLPALGHDFSVVVEKVAATCEKDGYTVYKCSRCDVTHREDVKALGHDYVGTVTKEPDCVNTGVMTYVCKNDASHTYTEEIPALGHVWCENFECEHDHEHYDDSYHWFMCLICGEKKDVEKHVYGEEINGYKFCKCGHWIEVEEPGIDPEPDKGDNTLELTFGFLAIASLMAAAAYVCKRKFAK